MKRLVLGKYLGCCDGVMRSIELLYRAISSTKGKIYTDGPIVHNAKILEKFSKLGVSVLEDKSDISEEDCIIVRAHGITSERKNLLKSFNCSLIDGTCPKILRIIGLVKKYCKHGYFIILLGDPNHPEIIGIRSYIDEDKVYVVSCLDDIKKKSDLSQPALLVAQTTFNVKNFNDINNYVKTYYPNIHVINTICDATQERQSEVKSLIQDKRCDLIVIVGSNFSKNVNELLQTANENNCEAIIADRKENLDKDKINKAHIVGLISGASTEESITREIISELLALISE